MLRRLLPLKMAENHNPRNSSHKKATERSLSVLSPGKLKAQLRRQAPKLSNASASSWDASDESDGWETDLECDEVGGLR